MFKILTIRKPFLGFRVSNKKGKSFCEIFFRIAFIEKAEISQTKIKKATIFRFPSQNQFSQKKKFREKMWVIRKIIFAKFCLKDRSQDKWSVKLMLSRIIKWWQYIWSVKRKEVQGVPKNSVTNSISSLLWISNVIPNFKTHNIIMSKHKQSKCEHSRRNSYRLQLSQ